MFLGRTTGGLYAGATAGKGISASASLGGGVDGGSSYGVINAASEAGGIGKQVFFNIFFSNNLKLFLIKNLSFIVYSINSGQLNNPQQLMLPIVKHFPLAVMLINIFQLAVVELVLYQVELIPFKLFNNHNK